MRPSFALGTVCGSAATCPGIGRALSPCKRATWVMPHCELCYRPHCRPCDKPSLIRARSRRAPWAAVPLCPCALRQHLTVIPGVADSAHSGHSALLVPAACHRAARAGSGADRRAAAASARPRVTSAAPTPLAAAAATTRPRRASLRLRRLLLPLERLAAGPPAAAADDVAGAAAGAPARPSVDPSAPPGAAGGAAACGSCPAAESLDAGAPGAEPLLSAALDDDDDDDGT